MQWVSFCKRYRRRKWTVNPGLLFSINFPLLEGPGSAQGCDRNFQPRNQTRRLNLIGTCFKFREIGRGRPSCRFTAKIVATWRSETERALGCRTLGRIRFPNAPGRPCVSPCVIMKQITRRRNTPQKIQSPETYWMFGGSIVAQPDRYSSCSPNSLTS